MRSGALLIEVARPAQVTNLLNMNTLFNIKVGVTPHRSLNSVKGVIRCTDLIDTTEAEILEGLSTQGVIAVKKISDSWR